MDSSSVDIFGRRKRKLSKRQNSNMGQDLISNLPKHIIGCILSFLPAKEAVRTSILSKRWNNVWTYITKLKFDDMEHYSSNKIRKTRFVDFVDMILIHLLSRANIQSFSLALSWARDYSLINKWINVVLTFRIKKLCVDLKKEHTIPSNTFFQCKSLEELVLNRCAITFSTSVSLSSLTVLKLCNVTITCDSSNESETLALNFPALRKYETCDCIWLGVSVRIVTLQAPLLEVVSIKYTPRSTKSHDVGIELYAWHLTKFYYCGFLSIPDSILLDAHSLAYADIALYNNQKSWQEVETFVSKLLSINPKSLKLCVCIKKVCFLFFLLQFLFFLLILLLGS
jgi:hypothetical protein